MPYNTLISNQTTEMKLFQYDKKVWEDGTIYRTWQIGILKNKSLLWVNYEDSSQITEPCGPLYLGLSLFGSSFIGFDLQIKNQKSFSIHVFTEYDEGWDT
jgi:hypothetical protein